nr:hypothetical protein W06G6.4 - Caenorhabditis elegans [Caenorhabditis elegans]
MIYQITHTIISAFGIMVNGFMMYLALTKSPKIMRPCSVIITIKTATDILASLTSFFVMQRLITDGTSIFIIPTGPCTRISPIACYSGHMFMICFLEHNLIWMISSYIFRYYILYVRDPSVQTLCLTACCLSIPSLIHISTWISFYEPVELSTELTKIVELYPNDIVLGGSIIYWSTLVLMVQLFFTAFLVVLTYFWIRDVLVSFSTKMGDRNISSFPSIFHISGCSHLCRPVHSRYQLHIFPIPHLNSFYVFYNILSIFLHVICTPLPKRADCHPKKGRFT